MFSDSDDDESESSGFFFWNNWVPKKSLSSIRSNDESSFTTRAVSTSCKTWLPPKSFGNRRKIFLNETSSNPSTLEQTVIAESGDLVKDWGPRMVLGSSYSNIEENELTWNYISAGLFGHFKLERNTYGQIIAFAEAEVDNGDAEGKAFIEINKEQHLRILLGLSVDDWNAFIEALGSSKFCLRYEALKKRPANLSIGEKLWYFLCRRRHYLPIFAIRLRRNGAKKMAQFFDIFPKFRVEQIRTCDGQELI